MLSITINVYVCQENNLFLSFMGAPQASADAPQASADVHKASVDVHKASVDVHKASVDVHKASVDAHKLRNSLGRIYSKTVYCGGCAGC
jgi:hypothetical protein